MSVRERRVAALVIGGHSGQYARVDRDAYREQVEAAWKRNRPHAV